MDDYVYKQFADALLSLLPDFPIEADEISSYIKTLGLEGFSDIADGYDNGLIETVELIIKSEKGGVVSNHG